MNGITVLRKRTLRHAILLVALLGSACNDDPTRAQENSPPLPALDGLVVSNPPDPTVGSAAGLSSVPDPVYMSVRPGAVPQGSRIDFTNTRTGVTVGASLVDGGVDPVAIEAVAGDTIDVRISGAGLVSALRYRAVVPGRRPPVIVRTSPPKGKRDVPLSASLLVIMSEPIDPASVTTATVRLTRNGVAIAGTVTMADAHNISLVFTPAEPLAVNTEYQLHLTREVRDHSGEHLENVAVIEFMTTLGSGSGPNPVPAPTPPPPPTVPAVDPTLGVYERASPPHTSLATTSRIVLRTGGYFDFEYEMPDGGRFTFPGRYAANGSTLSLIFDSWSLPGPWTAEITIAADSLHVRFGIIALLDDFEDGVYVLAPAKEPPPSPTGRIAFTHVRHGIPFVSVANADRTGGRELAVGSQPAWSPDGSRLAFIRSSGTASLPTLHTMSANGTGQVQLGRGLHPAWSPDGQHIAFSQDTAIAVMRTDGSNPVILVRVSDPGVPPGTTHLGNPRWSPAGNSIAFESRVGNSPAMQGGREVLIVSASGGIPTLLSNDGWAKSSPSWSPDGTQISVRSYDHLSPGLDEVLLVGYTVSSGVRQIHYRSAGWPGFSQPAYAPDWRHLAFTIPSGTGYGIMLLELGSGTTIHFSADVWREHSWGTSSSEAAWWQP